MADVLTKRQRSFNMSRIKGRDTALELKMRGLIYKRGLRGYRLHPKLTGRPDLVFSKKRCAVFFDGCFWHRCKRHGAIPQTHKIFWKEKLKRNTQRDKEVNVHYKKIGWKVLRIWEHEIKKDPGKAVGRIIRFLK